MDDIDKVILRGVAFGHLRHVCGGFVDIANAPCRARDASGLGLCVISAPVYVFVSGAEKGQLSRGLKHVIPDRFLPVSDNAAKFLSTSQPRKIHLDDMMEAFLAAEISVVNVLVYGMKSMWPLFLWLNDVGNADVELDVGHMLTMNPPGIHLARKAQGVDIGGFEVSTWPMLSTTQRDVGSRYYGSVQLQSPDPSHPINGILAVKVYPTLTHVVKGLATANFGTLPKTVQLARKRRAQVAQLLRDLHSTDYTSSVTKVRIEVTMKLRGDLSELVDVARQVGQGLGLGLGLGSNYGINSKLTCWLTRCSGHIWTLMDLGHAPTNGGKYGHCLLLTCSLAASQLVHT